MLFQHVVISGLEPSVCRSSDISPRTPSTPPLPPCPVLPHRFVAVPGLDARRVESGIYRDMGNEREKGERAVMEADKVGIGYADAGWDVGAATSRRHLRFHRSYRCRERGAS